nr:hypothetical protein [Tanacetum cinerariifolium]
MDTSYGSKGIHRIKNCSNAFSCEVQAMIRRIFLVGYDEFVRNQAEFRESEWNQNGNGNLVAVHSKGNAAGQNGNQIRPVNGGRLFNDLDNLLADIISLIFSDGGDYVTSSLFMDGIF